MVFPFQRERVFHVNICVLMYDCYFELLILIVDNITWYLTFGLGEN